MVSGSGGTTSDLFMNFKVPSPRTEMKETMEVNNQTGFFGRVASRHWLIFVTYPWLRAGNPYKESTRVRNRERRATI